MSLDIYVKPEAEPPQDAQERRYVCSLDDDGYYWWLWPLFQQLEHETGRMIDLYSHACFSGSALDALLQTLAMAHTQALAQPPQWGVVTGFDMNARRTPICEVVEKAEMLKRLDVLGEAARHARLKGESLIFIGD